VQLFEALDAYVPTPERAEDKPFLMSIEDVFSIKGRGTVGTGRIERGKVKVGDEVEIIGLMKAPEKTVVTGVEMFNKTLEYGVAGNNVGVLLRGIERTELERGQVLARPGSITPHTKFEASVYVEQGGGRPAHAVLLGLPAAVLLPHHGRDRLGDAALGRGGVHARRQREHVGGADRRLAHRHGRGPALRHPRGRPHRRPRRHHDNPSAAARCNSGALPAGQGAPASRLARSPSGSGRSGEVLGGPPGHGGRRHVQELCHPPVKPGPFAQALPLQHARQLTVHLLLRLSLRQLSHLPHGGVKGIAKVVKGERFVLARGPCHGPHEDIK
jgi:hypothetical protein